MGRNGWSSSPSPGLGAIIAHKMGRLFASNAPRSGLLPGAGGASPRLQSGNNTPNAGRASPGIGIGVSNHGHARRSTSWFRIDKFTVVCALFVLLLIYTLWSQTSKGTQSRPSPRPLSLSHSRSHRGHDHGAAGPVPGRAPAAVYQSTYETNAPDVSVGGSDTTFELRRLPLLEPSEAFPLDSTAETLMLKPRNDRDFSHAYHVCTFTNVCTAPDGLRLRFQNHTRWLEYRDLAKRCDDQAFYWSNKICHCFHYAFKPMVLPYEFQNEISEPLEQVRRKDVEANAGAPPDVELTDSLARRYPDPFAHVEDAKHGHYWSIHKWVPHHHIAHWAQKLLIFQSIYQHHELLDPLLPPLDGLVFHDTSATNPPLEGHMLSVFSLAVESAVGFTNDEGGAGTQWSHPNLWNGPDAAEQVSRIMSPESGRTVWAEDLLTQRYTTTLEPGACMDDEQEGTHSRCTVMNPAYQAARIAMEAAAAKAGNKDTLASPPTNADGSPLVETVADPSLHTCFARVSLSPTYALLSMDAADASRFREVTAERMGLESASAPCPPRRAILLTRPDRRILNVKELDQYMLEKWGLELEHHELSGRNTSLEQVRLFASSGLVLSSHSSQLINVLFSHPAQALVEIEAEFYNVDFASYAHALGLNFHYALGGSIPPSQKEHPEQLAEYSYVNDPTMFECVASLRRECPTGDSWCFTRKSPGLCNKVVQWPNKQMNFLADMEAVDVAVHGAIAHIQDKCFGKW